MAKEKGRSLRTEPHCSLPIIFLALQWRLPGDNVGCVVMYLYFSVFVPKLSLVTVSWSRSILRLSERIKLCDIRGTQERSDNSRADRDLILKSVLYKDGKEA